MANVRFYRLETLPSFVLEKHNGIFVHVTETMHNSTWKPTVGNEVNPAILWMEPEKVGESVERINLVKWLSTRHIVEIASGLWFGGENGWELLSNETTDAAIDAAITTKIQGLVAGPYAQAEITTATNSSTLTIKGIKEADGIIGIPVDTENRDLNIKIDGVYNETSNKIATESTVTTAIEGLNVNTAVQAVTFNTSVDNGNTTLTFKGIKETNGVIAQGDEQNPDTFIVGDAKLNIEIGLDSFEVFSANAKENKSIYLDKNVFKKNVVDGKNVLSVITKNNDVSSDNPLVTKNDINSLAGAMHYRGTINDPSAWPTTVKAGDVYISTVNRNFIHNEQQPPIEPGDMIVFNTDNVNTDYTVVQSNLTLGTGDGQIAKNVGVLANGNLVVATQNGIKTTSITETQLTGADNNKRTLSINEGDADGDFHHDVTISDAFTVIGKDFTKTINISSTNRSIEISKKTVGGVDTGVMVDLVWNTTIE